MIKRCQYIPRREYESETTDELIGLLTAISIVSKRLAGKIELLRETERKRGDTSHVRTSHAHAD